MKGCAKHMGKIEVEYAPCPMGCAEGDDTVLQGSDRLHGLAGRFTVVRCRECGLMRTNPRPTPQSIIHCYPEDYRPHVGTRIHCDREGHTVVRPRWRQRLSRLLDLNNKRVPSVRPGRMLEIGCASGAFMHEMAQAGWDVSGVEISPSAGRHAQAHGYPVHIGPVESASYEANSFDLIVGWMVLEHVQDLIQCLTRMRLWVRHGGWMVISVPNVDSWEFKYFRDAWYALQLPTHLFHFSAKTATMLLNNTGWSVEKVFQQRVITDILASIGYKLMDNINHNYISRLLTTIPDCYWNLNYFLYPISFAIAASGHAGRMTIWAKNL